MRIVTVKVPKAYVDELDNLIKAGFFPSRSEAIRIAIRDLLQKELWSVKRIELRETRATR
ncbi:MAG: ribbon-helix-helix domain-containing protein [Candidatus Nezhaarchaeales archaeon]